MNTPKREQPGRTPRARILVVRGARPRRRRSLFVSAFLWIASFPAVVLCATVLVPGVWYAVDIAANLAAQWVLLAVGWSVIAMVFRRGLLAVVCLSAAALPAWTLLQGRAAVLPLPEVRAEVSPEEREPSRTVRVLHFNTSAGQSDARVLEDLARHQPDVIAVTEPSGVLWRDRSRLFASVDGGAASADAGDAIGRVAFWADPERTMLMGSGFVASRWPMQAWDISDLGDAARRVIAGRVDSPHGPFVVLGTHPRSPRDEVRWRFGNQDVEIVAAAAQRAREQGLPVVVLADLNSTPSGARSRRLAEVGLRRAKPVLKPLGTWPTSAVPGAGGFIGRWPLAIAIDDALVSDDWTVLAWTRGESRGSDHWPVIADLRLVTEAKDRGDRDEK